MNDGPSLLFKDIALTAIDIRASGWRSAIDFHWDGSYTSLDGAFIAAAQAATEAGDSKLEQVCVLLGATASMHFNGNNPDEPYTPLFSGPQGRSVGLVDFEDKHLIPLSEVYAEIEDDEFRSRIGDILWLRKKDHQAARVAIAARMNLAKATLDPADWVEGFHHLQRALQIASSLGKANPEFGQVSTFAVEHLQSLNGTDPGYLTSRIVMLLLDHKGGDPSVLAGFVTLGAENAESRKEWMVAADYWALVHRCLHSLDPEAARQAQLRQGHAQVAIGDEMLGKAGLAAEHWLEVGFQTLRQAGADKAELKGLQAKLHAAQQDGLKHFGRVEASVPLSAEAVAQIESVRELPFREGLVRLARQGEPPPKAHLQQMHRELVGSSRLASLFRMSILREDGKTDCVIPRLPWQDEPEERVMNMHMWRWSATTQSVSAFYIDNLRVRIMEAHPWEDTMLDWLLVDNLFIPKGRVHLYQRGIRAGLEGDYIVSTHLLVPQLENSFRYVLGQHGVQTTFMCQDGTQDEYPLNTVLACQEFEEIFGEDLAFGLRGLLAERAGNNLRNSVSHGLISAGNFYAPEHRVLFATTLWLLLKMLEGGLERFDETKKG